MKAYGIGALFHEIINPILWVITSVIGTFLTAVLVRIVVVVFFPGLAGFAFWVTWIGCFVFACWFGLRLRRFVRGHAPRTGAGGFVSSPIGYTMRSGQ